MNVRHKPAFRNGVSVNRNIALAAVIDNNAVIAYGKVDASGNNVNRVAGFGRCGNISNIFADRINRLTVRGSVESGNFVRADVINGRNAVKPAGNCRYGRSVFRLVVCIYGDNGLCIKITAVYNVIGAPEKVKYGFAGGNIHGAAFCGIDSCIACLECMRISRYRSARYGNGSKRRINTLG